MAQALDEGGVSDEERKDGLGRHARSGLSEPLIQLMQETMRLRGETPADMSEQTGLNAGFWALMLSGQKPVSKLTDEFLRAIAKWLKVPPVQVFLLVGRLSLEDFMDLSTLDDVFNQVMDKLRFDPRFAFAVPYAKDLKGPSKELKVVFVLLYEEAFKARLLAKSPTIVVMDEGSR